MPASAGFLKQEKRMTRLIKVMKLAGIASMSGGYMLAVVALIVLYIALLGAALGAFVGAAAWAFRAITGL
jgi:uncharacterized membrane protein